MGFPWIINAPHVKLWVGEMTKFGLSDLVKTVNSKFGTKLTVTVTWNLPVYVFKYEDGETYMVLGLFNSRMLYCANKHCGVCCQSTISAETIKFDECYS